MENFLSLPAYDKIAEIIESVNSLTTPSEIHGLLCGIICSVGEKVDSESWATKAMGLGEQDVNLGSKATKQLQQLLEYSLNRLIHMAFDFQLLLPSDSASLHDRSLELGNWCHGFLTGLELSSDLDVTSEQLSVDGYDTLLKMSEIADIDYEDLDYNEQDEQAFLEVTEFVRLAVLVLFTELDRGASGISVPTSRMVH